MFFKGKKINKFKFVIAIFFVFVLFFGIFPQNTRAATTGDFVAAIAGCFASAISFFGVGTTITNWVGATNIHYAADVFYALTQVISFFVGVVGFFFNEVFSITVINMSANIEKIKVIEVGWTVIRDMANILFIFMLLYLAIATILQLDEHGVKHGLSRLIVGAMLINFSLFFVKIPIDVSNIIAIEIYNKINPTGTQDYITGGSGRMGLGDSIMSMFQPQKVFKDTTSSQGWLSWITGSNSTTPTVFINNPTTTFIMAVIIMLSAMFIFMAVIIIFIKRFISLIMLMIFSPLAFAGMAIPNHNIEHEITSKFWGQLLKESFYAPAFMLMLYLTIQVGQSISSSTSLLGKTKWEDWVGLPVANMISYSVVLGMLIFSLTIAETMGVKGASGAIKFFDKARGATTSYIGKNTLGRIGNTIREKGGSAVWLRDSAAGLKGDNVVSKFVYTQLGRAGVSLTSKASGSKFGGSKSYEDKVSNREAEFKAAQDEHHDDPNISAKILMRGKADKLGVLGTDFNAAERLAHVMTAEQHADTKMKLENIAIDPKASVAEKELAKETLERHYTSDHGEGPYGRLTPSMGEKVENLIKAGRPAHLEQLKSLIESASDDEFLDKASKMTNGQRRSSLISMRDSDWKKITKNDDGTNNKQGMERMALLMQDIAAKDTSALEAIIKDSKTLDDVKKLAENSIVNGKIRSGGTAMLQAAKDPADKLIALKQLWALKDMQSIIEEHGFTKDSDGNIGGPGNMDAVETELVEVAKKNKDSDARLAEFMRNQARYVSPTGETADALGNIKKYETEKEKDTSAKSMDSLAKKVAEYIKTP